jgi:hypothetical protein
MSNAVFTAILVTSPFMLYLDALAAAAGFDR